MVGIDADRVYRPCPTRLNFIRFVSKSPLWNTVNAMALLYKVRDCLNLCRQVEAGAACPGHSHTTLIEMISHSLLAARARKPARGFYTSTSCSGGGQEYCADLGKVESAKGLRYVLSSFAGKCVSFAGILLAYSRLI